MEKLTIGSVKAFGHGPERDREEFRFLSDHVEAHSLGDIGTYQSNFAYQDLVGTNTWKTTSHCNDFCLHPHLKIKIAMSHSR